MLSSYFFKKKFDVVVVLLGTSAAKLHILVSCV